MSDGASPNRRSRLAGVLACISIAVLLPPLPASAANGDHGKSAWNRSVGKPPDTKNGHKADVKPDKFTAYSVNRGQMNGLLKSAPKEARGNTSNGLVISLPSPAGIFQDFSLVESPIMEPGLAAKPSSEEVTPTRFAASTSNFSAWR